MNFEKPERKQIRLRGYDYSQDGYYFVTICTNDREEFFGDIRNGIMGLNEIGNIAAKFWQEIPEHFSFVRLGEWVVMPNHMHGILGIEKPDVLPNILPNVGTRDLASLQQKQHGGRKFGPLQKHSLSSIVHAYKSSLKRWCNKNGFDYFAWQGRFYDHIIRNDRSLENISAYIQNNPIKWTEDVENRKNKFSENQIKRHYDDLFGN